MKTNIIKLSLLMFAYISLFSCTENTPPKQQSFQQPYQSMLVYPKQNKIEHFELIKHDGSKFEETSFSNRWNLIFIGYTNCPDVCPNTLTDITNIYKKIKPELQKQFQIVFFSVDPKRDNPEHLGKYIDYFHDDLVGITGDKIEIDKLVGSLGGIYSLNTEEGDYYSVDHTARIFIVSPKGERYGIITSESMHSKDKSLLIKELELMAESGH